jgi:uncharacterized protein (UPF0332 family)
MSINNLITKAEHNHKTGMWAEGNEFYDAAISRYYYSLYEKIIYISKKEGFYSEPPIGKDSHIYTIDEFKKNVIDKLQPKDITMLAALSKLKKCRVIADYNEKIIKSKNDFNLSFKAYYNFINDIIDKFL